MNPFPILCKDTRTNIEAIIQSDELLSQRTYVNQNLSVESLLSMYHDNVNALLFGQSTVSGYPINNVLKAVAFLIANDDELAGNRPRGYMQILEKHVTDDNTLCVEVLKPDLLTPLVMAFRSRGALIGALNPRVYEKLVSRDPNNQYKILVRKITKEDLCDAE